MKIFSFFACLFAAQITFANSLPVKTIITNASSSYDMMVTYRICEANLGDAQRICHTPISRTIKAKKNGDNYIVITNPIQPVDFVSLDVISASIIDPEGKLILNTRFLDSEGKFIPNCNGILQSKEQAFHADVNLVLNDESTQFISCFPSWFYADK
jgi:hypothetical protein